MASRVSFKVKKFTDPLHRAVAEIDSLRDIMEDIAEEGADVAQDFINSRPSLKSGKPGRATGTDMAADVVGKVTTPRKHKYVMRIGWLNRNEDWYKLQESGFMFVRAIIPFWIEGTNALEDAGEIVQSDMDAAVTRYKRRIGRLAVGKEK